MTGVGGGSLMTPILVLVFGFHPATAVGTDLLYASATKLAAPACTLARQGRLARRARLATGSVPATLLTLVALSIAADAGRGYRPRDHRHSGRRPDPDRHRDALSQADRRPAERRIRPPGATADQWLTIALGVVLGMLVTLTSVGAGALGMTALLVLYPRAPVARLVGSDIAHAVPLTLIAGLGHLAMGSVDLGLLLSLLIGSIPGIIIGSLIASRMPDRVLTPILAATLTVVGAKLVL